MCPLPGNRMVTAKVQWRDLWYLIWASFITIPRPLWQFHLALILVYTRSVMSCLSACVCACQRVTPCRGPALWLSPVSLYSPCVCARACVRVCVVGLAGRLCASLTARARLFAPSQSGGYRLHARAHLAARARAYADHHLAAEKVNSSWRPGASLVVSSDRCPLGSLTELIKRQDLRNAE